MAVTNARTGASRTTTDLLRRAAFGARPQRTLVRVAAIVAAAVVVFGYLLIPVRGEGPSMTPTIGDGQLVFVNTLAYWRSAPRRGDIVALRLAGRRLVYVKRIVGLPGERVSITRGTVLIDGGALMEPYVARRNSWNVAELTLAPDEYLVIGDNRGMAMRMHEFGRTRRDRILGRVLTFRP